VHARELHGDGDDNSTAVMGLDFMTDTAGMAYCHCRLQKWGWGELYSVYGDGWGWGQLFAGTCC